MRYGSRFILNDEGGHILMMLLMRLKISPDEATLQAPWMYGMERAELRKLANRAWAVKWDDFGERLHLTRKERHDTRTYFMRPEGMTWEQVKQEQAERRKTLDRERYRRKREAERGRQAMIEAATDREVAIEQMLPIKRYFGIPWWISVPKLVQLIRERPTLKAFRKPDGRPLNPSSLRVLVHIAVARMEERGLVETEKRPGDRGMVLFVRRKDQAECGHKIERNSVKAEPKAKSQGGSMASSEKGEQKNISLPIVRECWRAKVVLTSSDRRSSKP
jgi:hypothetical protein